MEAMIVSFAEQLPSCRPYASDAVSFADELSFSIQQIRGCICMVGGYEWKLDTHGAATFDYSVSLNYSNMASATTYRKSRVGLGFLAYLSNIAVFFSQSLCT